MSKAVLISIRPEWVEKILAGEKTLEVRKTRPKLETPFKCYIYCTKDAKDTDRLWVLNKQIRKEYNWLTAVCANLRECPDHHYLGNGKVCGEFICDWVDTITYDGGVLSSAKNAAFSPATCLSQTEIVAYIGGNGRCYGWHISNLKIYDAPKELNEFWFPPELYCEKERCGGCPYDQVADANGEYSFDCEWKRPLTRPPQSWCYVEEQRWHYVNLL